MNIKEILDKIIKKSFPELMGEDIRIEWKNLDDALMEQGGLTGHGYYIEVDKTLKKAKESVIIGGLAHELCHILTSIELSRGKSITDIILYRISIRYKTLDERNTDLQAIIRGYGKELLEFMNHSEKEGYDYYKEDGLSVMEIKALFNS